MFFSYGHTQQNVLKSQDFRGIGMPEDLLSKGKKPRVGGGAWPIEKRVKLLITVHSGHIGQNVIIWGNHSLRQIELLKALVLRPWKFRMIYCQVPGSIKHKVKLYCILTQFVPKKADISNMISTKCPDGETLEVPNDIL